MTGKPIDGKPRDARVVLRVLPDEQAAWTEAARRDGRTLSGWLRKIANDAVRTSAPATKPTKAGKGKR